MNEKQVAFLVGFCVITLFALPGSIIPVNSVTQSSLIAFYPLDSNANDYSGNSLNGVPIGISFTTGNGGKVGESAIFTNTSPDGTSGINLPLSPLLEFSHSTNFTIMAWIKTTSSNTMEIFAQQKCTYGTVQVYLSNGKANFRLEDVNNIDTYLTSSVLNINNGQWHNITATRDGTNHELHLFVDGKESSTKDTTTGFLTNSVTMNAIGKRYICGTTNNFVGNIDEVKIYSNMKGTASYSSYQVPTIPNQVSTKQNQVSTISNNFNLNEYLGLFIIVIGIFVVGSILGISTSKRKKLSREQNSHTVTYPNTPNQFTRPQARQNFDRRSNNSFCSSCGHHITFGDVFCENCGQRIT